MSAQHERRADQIVEMLRGCNLEAGLLLLGCGLGHTVEALDRRGIRTLGWEASAELAASSMLIRHVDALTVDLRHGPPASAVITEDLLPCLSDREARWLSRKMARAWPDAVRVHLVSVSRGDIAEREPRGNWKSVGAWARLMAPDPVYDILELGEQ